jgi:hypothetical protein
MAYYHQNTKDREKEKNIDGWRQNKQITHKGKPIKITAYFSMENLKSKKGMEWGISGTE